MNTPRLSATNEEPELGVDESIPLDGTDPEGEEMMRDLGRDLEKRANVSSGEAMDGPGPLPDQLPVS